jgi:hypothetical protein
MGSRTLQVLVLALCSTVLAPTAPAAGIQLLDTPDSSQLALTSQHHAVTATAVSARRLEDITSLDEIIDLARLAITIETQRPILARGTELCQNVADVVRLLAVCKVNDALLRMVGNRGIALAANGPDVLVVTRALYENGQRSQVRDELLLSGADKARTIAEIVALSADASAYAVADQIALSGVRLAHSAADVAALQNACWEAATKDEILRRYLELIRAAQSSH